MFNYTHYIIEYNSEKMDLFKSSCFLVVVVCGSILFLLSGTLASIVSKTSLNDDDDDDSVYYGGEDRDFDKKDYDDDRLKSVLDADNKHNEDYYGFADNEIITDDHRVVDTDKRHYVLNTESPDYDYDDDDGCACSSTARVLPIDSIVVRCSDDRYRLIDPRNATDTRYANGRHHIVLVDEETRQLRKIFESMKNLRLSRARIDNFLFADSNEIDCEFYYYNDEIRRQRYYEETQSFTPSLSSLSSSSSSNNNDPTAIITTTDIKSLSVFLDDGSVAAVTSDDDEIMHKERGRDNVNDDDPPTRKRYAAADNTDENRVTPPLSRTSSSGDGGGDKRDRSAAAVMSVNRYVIVNLPTNCEHNIEKICREYDVLCKLSYVNDEDSTIFYLTIAATVCNSIICIVLTLISSALCYRRRFICPYMIYTTENHSSIQMSR